MRANHHRATDPTLSMHPHRCRVLLKRLLRVVGPLHIEIIMDYMPGSVSRDDIAMAANELQQMGKVYQDPNTGRLWSLEHSAKGN